MLAELASTNVSVFLLSETAPFTARTLPNSLSRTFCDSR